MDALPWRQTPFPGVQIKVLLEDQASGLMTTLTRMAPGAVLPLHERVDVELTYVLEGRLVDEEGEVRTGEYIWQPGGSVRSELIERADRNYLGIVQYVDVDFFILGTHADAEHTEPGGDYGFAWNPIGSNARDIEHFVNLLGFSPMDAIPFASRLAAHTKRTL
jgi:hypothetical protein